TATDEVVRDALDARPSGWAQGPRGHAWEQVLLPVRSRRAGVTTLWSPANFGPIAVRDQVVVVHDLGPFVDAEDFDRTYRLVARAVLRGLAARGVRFATPSRRVVHELHSVLGVDEGAVAVVPPGIGPPFSTWPLDDVGTRPRPYCVAVGLHDRRKRIDFLTALWPEVHARTGLELHVTGRSSATTTVASAFAARQGVVLHRDPSDAQLAELYAGALCLLWPSRYEGFGLPLLECMATGTPFLAADVGAAAELAVDPDRQLLPLESSGWEQAIVDLHAGDATELGRAGVAVARAHSWDEAADRTAALLRDQGGLGGA
ncbi:MAG: hypothetical protein QOE63_565, partial [Acidimicrobiaceae bacterium]